jgi:hypothetical protein
MLDAKLGVVVGHCVVIKERVISDGSGASGARAYRHYAIYQA